jgi:hypothetical protein
MAFKKFQKVKTVADTERVHPAEAINSIQQKISFAAQRALA